MIRRLAFALLLVAAPAAFAQGDAGFDTYFVNDPVQWGRATRIVEPVYPRDAFERRMQGHVDVKGTINWGGVMEVIELTPGTPESSAFVKAIADVLPDWRFNTVAGDDCLPSATPVTARVSFRIEDEKPKVSVTQATVAAAAGRPAFKAIHRTDPLYPDGMLRMGWQANVFARMEIDNQGSVAKVTATAFPKQRGVNLERFERAVVESLGEWKFPAAAADRKANRVACYDIYFRIKR